jgi:hypothetical protein
MSKITMDASYIILNMTERQNKLNCEIYINFHSITVAQWSKIHSPSTAHRKHTCASENCNGGSVVNVVARLRRGTRSSGRERDTLTLGAPGAPKDSLVAPASVETRQGLSLSFQPHKNISHESKVHASNANQP